MDAGQLIDILRATIDPNQRETAEKQLEQVHKIIGFAPSLLQVVMTASLDMPVRQAGAIYLKNLVVQFWQEKEPPPQTQPQPQPLPFHIHEQDRAMVRDALVDAMVHAPELIRVQLSSCLGCVLKHDFPGRWTGVVDKVSIYLQSPESAGWAGALLALYTLVKNYEYKKPEEREPLHEAMQLLLPLLQQRLAQLLADQSEASVLLQKQILKIYFALVQYHFPLGLISREVCTQWMELLRVILDRPVPDVANQVDEDERPELPWWKCKKWAFHIVTRIFERYGSPGSVSKEYGEFADFFLKAYTEGILQVVLRLLDQHRQKVYVSPRVLQHALNYLRHGVSHAFSWKFLKPHIVGIVLEVVFPLLCHNDQDDELWKTDPHEYIRLKYDVFEDFLSPVTAAQSLVHMVCKKRKGVLQRAMAFVVALLTSPACSPRQKDGALHLVGTVATLLLKRRMYKDQMEAMLVAHVYPEFGSSEGFLRARACWVLHYFCEMPFRTEANLLRAVELLTHCLLHDSELPVRVEAAIALQACLTCQEKAQATVKPKIKEITMELLKIIRETENDDLTNVMQKIVCMYADDIAPIAAEMTQHLVATFTQVVETGGDGDEKAMVAMGVLNTLDTLVTVLEEQRELVAMLEPTLLQLLVGQVLGQSLLEFYEEALSLLYSLSCRGPLSADMWKAFEALYLAFQKDAFDFFTDMMPALHNFVTVDTPGFVSNENHLLAMYNMCKAVLEGDSGEDPKFHALKLLEVIILQCKGQIDQCIPSFVELAIRTLAEAGSAIGLQVLCQQVVIAALYYNPVLLFETLSKIQRPDTQENLLDHFVKMWLGNIEYFMGLHDRKMCVLGLCTLISQRSRPQALSEMAPQVVPSLLVLFDGLKRAYACTLEEMAIFRAKRPRRTDVGREDFDENVHNIRPPLCKGREHIREEERQQQIDDALKNYKLEHAPEGVVTDLQQRLLAVEKELERLKQEGKKERPSVSASAVDSVPKSVHVNLVKQYKEMETDFRILKSNHEQLMKRFEDRNRAILEADESIFESKNSASDVRHRTPSPQRIVEPQSAEPDNDEEMNSSSDSEESTRTDSNTSKIGSVGENGKLYAGRGFWIDKQDWAKLFSAPTDSMFCKFAASLLWTKEELRARSVTGTISNRALSSGKYSSRLPLTPEKLTTLKGLFRHYVGKDALAQQRLKAVRRHLANALCDVRRPTIRRPSSSGRASLSVSLLESSAASSPACDDESIDGLDLGDGQSELDSSQCDQDLGEETIVGSSRDDGKIYAGCGRWVDRECWDTLMKSPTDSWFCRSASLIYWTTEQMKCRSVTGVLSNKSISLGVNKPKPALTPEKLNSLKALFRIYMGDRTPADIADKRMKDVRKHLCQKLGDVQRKGAS